MSVGQCDISYRDDSFPPEVALADVDGEDIGRLEWVPASMLLSADARQRSPLFSNIQPGGVRQGSIGDCWLIAALSCLADFPEEVEV